MTDPATPAAGEALTAESEALLASWPFTMTVQTCCGFPHGEHSREDPSIHPAHEKAVARQEMSGIRDHLAAIEAAAAARALAARPVEARVVPNALEAVAGWGIEHQRRCHQAEDHEGGFRECPDSLCAIARDASAILAAPDPAADYVVTEQFVSFDTSSVPEDEVTMPVRFAPDPATTPVERCAWVFKNLLGQGQPVCGDTREAHDSFREAHDGFYQHPFTPTPPAPGGRGEGVE